MLDNKEIMNNRIDDESLDGVAGGTEIRTLQFDRSQQIETHNAIMDKSQGGGIVLLNNATKSGSKNEKIEAIKNKNGYQTC